jgi:hypothetical protein
MNYFLTLGALLIRFCPINSKRTFYSSKTSFVGNGKHVQQNTFSSSFAQWAINRRTLLFEGFNWVMLLFFYLHLLLYCLHSTHTFPSQPITSHHTEALQPSSPLSSRCRPQLPLSNLDSSLPTENSYQLSNSST